MYLSRVRLRNWRSYEDAEFIFQAPKGGQRVVLIGAANGHGKTSLLFALYVGLYGRHGYRYTEGISITPGDEFLSYRNAIKQFRRTTAKSGDDTVIEIEIAPTEHDVGVPKVLVRRQWSFNSQGQPKSGDSFEAVVIYENGEPQAIQSHESACDYIGLRLFKDDVMPAFFFDGEQAQTLITKSGQEGMSKAVGVLYGTRLVEEAVNRMHDYCQTIEKNFGGKRGTEGTEARLEELEREVDFCHSRIERKLQECESLEQQKTSLEKEQDYLRRQCIIGGSDRGLEFKELDERFVQEQKRLSIAKNELKDTVASLGLLLALSRLSSSIITALQRDGEVEQRKQANETTMAKADAILSLAMPEPAEEDELLGNISAVVRTKVKERIRRAIDAVLKDATETDGTLMFPWLNVGLRQEVIARILDARHETGSAIRQKAQSVSHLEESVEELRRRRARIANLPAEVAELPGKIEALQKQIEAKQMDIGAARDQITRDRIEITRLNPEIAKLKARLSHLEPERRKVGIARAARHALQEIADELTKVTAGRLESVVTQNFRSIADQRFRQGEIRLPTNAKAVLERDNLPPAAIESMSGFERRAFGISFSLALAQITRKRIPFVIDTPLGNADVAYRERLLAALSTVDIDQVIILTHDAEVTHDLQAKIAPTILQRMLISYEQATGKSVVRNNVFFGDR